MPWAMDMVKNKEDLIQFTCTCHSVLALVGDQVGKQNRNITFRLKR